MSTPSTLPSSAVSGNGVGAAAKTMTFGVIVGNRGFFPDHLARSGRGEIIAALRNAGIEAVVLTPEESKYGAVETRDRVGVAVAGQEIALLVGVGVDLALDVDYAGRRITTGPIAA